MLVYIRGGGGGGGGRCGFFFRKQFFLISRFMLFSTLKKKKKCPFTYWLNGRWFLQIVERDSWNLYIHYILYSLVLILYLKFGGGGGNVFLTFYAISNISRNKNLGIQNNYFSFDVFLYAGNIVKFPFTYSYWLNGRWFLQIVDIWNFIMRLEIFKSAPSLNGAGGFSKS